MLPVLRKSLRSMLATITSSILIMERALLARGPNAVRPYNKLHARPSPLTLCATERSGAWELPGCGHCIPNSGIGGRELRHGNQETGYGKRHTGHGIRDSGNGVRESGRLRSPVLAIEPSARSMKSNGGHRSSESGAMVRSLRRGTQGGLKFPIPNSGLRIPKPRSLTSTSELHVPCPEARVPYPLSQVPCPTLRQSWSFNCLTQIFL